MSHECSCSTHVVIVSAALLALLLLCKQMLMMGFPHCTDKQAVRPSLRPLCRFTWQHVFSVSSHHFSNMTQIPVFFSFVLHSSFFHFLNSSLFSAHVYFYPTVHGRSQRNDEAWETCSSPWQLYSKPSFPNAAFITTSQTLPTLILLSHLFGPVLFRFSPPFAPQPHHPNPRTELSFISVDQRCVCGCRSFHRHCEAHFHVAGKSLRVFCSSRGFPDIPPSPLQLPHFYWVLLKKKKKANSLASSPFNNCNIWHPLLKPVLYCCCPSVLISSYRFNYSVKPPKRKKAYIILQASVMHFL